MRCADGLDGHNHSPQPPLSGVREPTARDDFILDLISGRFIDKITIRDLA